MKCKIDFMEIQSLVKLKFGREIVLTAVNEQTVKVETKVKAKVPLIGEVSKNIKVQFVVERVEDSNIYLSYKGGFGIDMIIGEGMALLFSTFSQNIAERIPNNGIVVHLNNIAKIQKVLKKIELMKISFDTQGINADCRLKL